jgi:hypothetical protein
MAGSFVRKVVAISCYAVEVVGWSLGRLVAWSPGRLVCGQAHGWAWTGQGVRRGRGAVGAFTALHAPACVTSVTMEEQDSRFLLGVIVPQRDYYRNSFCLILSLVIHNFWRREVEHEELHSVTIDYVNRHSCCDS